MDVNVDALASEEELGRLNALADEVSRNRHFSISLSARKALATLELLDAKIRDLGHRMGEVGENLIDTSENMAEGLTAPLAAIGAVAFKASADAGQAFSILQARVRGVKQTVQELKPIVDKVFRQGLGEDIQEVANVVGYARDQLKQLSNVELEKLVTNVLSLSKAFGVDAVTAIDQVKELMDKFKLSSTQAMDLVAAGYTAADFSVEKLTEGIKKNISEKEKAKLVASELNQKLLETKGAADKVRQALENSPYDKLAQHWRNLQDSVKPFGDTLNRIADEYLPKVTQRVRDLGLAFQGLPQSTQNTIVAITGFVAILPIAAMVVGSLMILGSGISKFFGGIGSLLAGAAGEVAFWGLAIAGVVTLLYNKVEETRAIFDEASGDLGDAFSNLGGVVSGVINFIIGILTGNWKLAWDGAVQAVNSAFQAVGNILLWAGKTILGIIMGIAVWIGNGFIWIYNKVVNISDSIGNWLSQKWNSIKTNSVSIWNSITNWLSQKWSSIDSFAQNIWSKITTWISQKWNYLLSYASRTFSGIRTSISNAFSGIYSAIIGWMSRALDGVLGYVARIKAALASIGGGGGTVAKRTVPTHTPVSRSRSTSTFHRLGSWGGWNAKGGFYDSPTIIGVGEAGPEAVVPLRGRNMKPFAEAVARYMPQSKQGVTIINRFYIQATIREEADLRKLAERLNRLQTIENRAGGIQYVGQI